jgi:hypothetical protein
MLSATSWRAAQSDAGRRRRADAPRGRGLQDGVPAAAPAPAGEPMPMLPSVGPDASGASPAYPVRLTTVQARPRPPERARAAARRPPARQGLTARRAAAQGMATGQHATVLKPGFHITAPAGWMNDPNGMFQSREGVYHVFYQARPPARARRARRPPARPQGSALAACTAARGPLRQAGPAPDAGRARSGTRRRRCGARRTGATSSAATWCTGSACRPP